MEKTDLVNGSLKIAQLHVPVLALSLCSSCSQNNMDARVSKHRLTELSNLQSISTFENIIDK